MPLKFLEIAFRSLSSSPACLLCFPRRPTVPRRPPPLWAGRRPTPVSPPPHASPLDPWTHFPRALELPPFATPPRTVSRPPPRRRRGEPAAPPQDVNSRAPQHLENPSTLFYALFHLLPLRKPRTPPPPPLPPELGARRGQPSSALSCPQLTLPIDPPHSRAAH